MLVQHRFKVRAPDMKWQIVPHPWDNETKRSVYSHFILVRETVSTDDLDFLSWYWGMCVCVDVNMRISFLSRTSRYVCH